MLVNTKRPILFLVLLALVYCSAKPVSESKEASKEVIGSTTDLPSEEHNTTEEGHDEHSTVSGEHKDESHEENHVKESTEEHAIKSSDVAHSKHEQKPKEKTTAAPQTNHVSDEHAEASE